MGTHDEEPRPPLGYRNPADDRPPGWSRVAVSLAGVACGIAVPVVVGFVVADTLRPGVTGTAIAIGFAVAAGGGFAGGVYALRPTNRGWFLGMFLLALGVTAGIEGACFVALAH